MKPIFRIAILIVLLLAGCARQSSPPSTSEAPVLAAESFLADITAQVAGGRQAVDTLIPAGIDPHAFEATPKDVARIAESRLIVINGAGLEDWLAPILENAGGQAVVVEASRGLTPRPGSEEHTEGDPHFWLDPLNVVTYVENIRDALTAYDPDGEAVYTANAKAYIAELHALDEWIGAQIATIPPERRLLVTNHESFGYYAARYGLRVVGAIVPSASSSASPSAQQLAGLIEQVRASDAPAIFLETGTNPQLAEQLALETGVKVVTGLMSHSLSAPNGPAPDYLSMMRYNTELIVTALRAGGQ